MTWDESRVLSRWMDSTARVEGAAVRRHGVITRAEARAGGLTDRQIRLRVDSGRWARHSKDVFIVAGAPRTSRQALLGATLRHNASACMWSAAWLLGLSERPPRRSDVARSSPRGAKDPEVAVHRLSDLQPRDLLSIDSIRTTNATRTLLDLASSISDDEWRDLVERACRRGLTHPDALRERCRSFVRPGRAGSARIRRVVASLSGDAALLESDLESLLLTLIVAAGLPAPVPQHRITVEGSVYRLDFAYPAARIAIEGDGFAFHSDRQRFETDRARQNALVLDGWLVLRFTWRQIVDEPSEVAAAIAAALALRSPGAAPG